ncbi:DNA adenine methylase [Pseudaminobacter sp. NGMCC 1.201702]|uniref:DNA adenine methylase n=1 Tax=Pseudaminobacter sp. NGMCC 1.201702 TaxID=3391825 RepID=UPI0039F0BF19
MQQGVDRFMELCIFLDCNTPARELWLWTQQFSACISLHEISNPRERFTRYAACEGRGNEVSIKPFLKWAGGKRWLADRGDFQIPPYEGRYIEPFLGGGAIYFSIKPSKSIISDFNHKLIELYLAIRDEPVSISKLLFGHHKAHSKDYYYGVRAKKFESTAERAAQFLYLNRACWNGLYRENLKGEFNVPIGTKSIISFDDDDFEAVSAALAGAEIRCCDFEETINEARTGDFLFVDPPYTTAHNFNGFVKYNQKIFSWEDQVRLRHCVLSAVSRGAKVIVTNADHPSISELYRNVGGHSRVTRPSVISGKASGRKVTSELIIRFNM